MTERVRVMRILVYEGTREWVETTLQQSSVPLTGVKHAGPVNRIKSCLIDQFPEILDEEEEVMSPLGFLTEEERLMLQGLRGDHENYLREMFRICGVPTHIIPRSVSAERAMEQLGIMVFDAKGNMRADVDILTDMEGALIKWREAMSKEEEHHGS